MSERDEKGHEISMFLTPTEKLHEMEFICHLFRSLSLSLLLIATPAHFKHYCRAHFSCKQVLREATDIGCKKCHAFCAKCLFNYCQESIPKKWGKLICPKCPRNQGLVKTWMRKTSGPYAGEYGWQDSTRPGYPIKPSALVKRQIGKLQVECERKEKGCAWVGCFKDKKTHFLNECEYRRVKCGFGRCAFMGMKKDMKNHQKTCEFRRVKCPLCS